MHNETLHKNRFRTAAQWIQAIITLCILGIVYSASQWAEGKIISGGEAQTMPITFEQEVFWDHNLEKSAIQYASTSDKKNGIVFEDDRVRVAYYADLSMEEIEKIHHSDIPRAFSYSSQGIAVIEGDINATSAQNIVTQLHAR